MMPVVVQSRTDRAAVIHNTPWTTQPRSLFLLARPAAGPAPSLALRAAARAAPASQDGGRAAPAADAHPPTRHATVVRFFCLEGDVKADLLRKAVAELSTKETECRVQAGPLTSGTRPGKHVLALESPASCSLADAL